MTSFHDTAWQLFLAAKNAAQSDAGYSQDFAVAVRPDGGLHLFMESPFSVEGIAGHLAARSIYKVTTSNGCIRIEGRAHGGARCCFEDEKRADRRAPPPAPLRDQPLYLVSSPASAGISTASPEFPPR